jgi:hypothetical protein
MFGKKSLSRKESSVDVILSLVLQPATSARRDETGGGGGTSVFHSSSRTLGDS